MNGTSFNPSVHTVRALALDRSKLWIFICVAVTLLLGASQARSAFAAPGDLDPTFGRDGKVTTDFFGHGDEAYGIAIQSDGKIVAVGNSDVSGSNNDFALSRYNTDGTLDDNFDADGRVTTPILSGNDYAHAVAIQSDGKIVAAGSANYGNTLSNDFALARYLSDGSLDTTFSGNGKVITNFLRGSDQAYAVAIQSDGKIVAAGYATDPSSSKTYFALARYNSNGSLDTTFGGGDGMVTTDFGISSHVFDLAIQTDGKIVVAGTVGVEPSSEDFALARYNPNGSLDTSFSFDGKVTTDFFANQDEAYAVAIQSDGKIVAAGTADVDANNDIDFALVRYTPDGTLDNTFSGNGKVVTDFLGGNNYANTIAIQSDGKIVAGGGAENGTIRDFALARYNPNGSLDTTFSGDGKVTTDFAGDSDYANDVAIQGNGKIVAAGFSGSDFALARYDGDTFATPTPTSTVLPITPTQTPGGPTATPTQITCSFQFTDVLPNSTFYVYIQCLVCRGIVSGYPDGTFRPGNNVTRGQLSKIVSNAAGFNDLQTTQMFEDIPIGSPFFDYIGRLASRGYIGGFVCGGPAEPCVAPGNLPYFRPNANASRGQISKIVSNAAGFVEPAGVQMFEDVAPGSTFYDFIERLTSRGIIAGYPCGGPAEPCGGGNLPYFRPSNNSTRGQTSKIVSNTFFPNCQAP